MRSLLTITLVSAAMILASGCKTTSATGACSCNPCKCSSPCQCGSKQASLGMMNDACPMSGNKLKADCPKSSYKGETIGFCGNGCKAKFDSMDAQGQTDYVAQVKSNGS